VSFAAVAHCVASQRVFVVVISFRHRPETFGYTLVHLFIFTLQKVRTAAWVRSFSRNNFLTARKGTNCTPEQELLEFMPNYDASKSNLILKQEQKCVLRCFFCYCFVIYFFRSQWPRHLSHVLSSTARTLGSWVRIPLEAWMCVRVFLCCVVLWCR
jgi:hypothetical protein